jgi:alkylation response protein AidB-like acyl-CoA dehydrogenase
MGDEAFALDLAGGDGFVTENVDPELEKLQGSYLWSAGLRIAGGTDEILRNIIAERVLGLPEEVRADKGIPFNEVPR